MVTGNPQDNNAYGDDNRLIESVVQIKRVSKVVKGGRNINFNALVVVGDGNGSVGVALGKAPTVVDAIRKGSLKARRAMKPVNLKKNTIPHTVVAKYSATKVMLKPAGTGTGIVAGAPTRSVVEAAGVTDILTKRFGSNNNLNTVKATLKGLQMLLDTDKQYHQRRTLHKQNDEATTDEQD